MSLKDNSFKLEEKIKINYQIIGSQKWLDKYIPTSVSHNISVWSPSIKKKLIDYLSSLKVIFIDTESNGPFGGDKVKGIVTGKQIGRASCRERV